MELLHDGTSSEGNGVHERHAHGTPSHDDAGAIHRGLLPAKRCSPPCARNFSQSVTVASAWQRVHATLPADLMLLVTVIGAAWAYDADFLRAFSQIACHDAGSTHPIVGVRAFISRLDRSWQ